MATFGLVFIGCGAMALNQATGGRLTGLGVAAAWGVAILGMVFAFGNVSGAHMNPAITIGLWWAGRFEKKAVVPYVLAQLAGAAAGALILRGIFGAGSNLGMTVPAGAVWVSFALEALMTGTLVFAVLSEMAGQRVWALVAGAIVILEIFLGGSVSGASMNPARSFGPALISGRWAHHWIYWAAPLLGGWGGVKARGLLGSDPCRPSPESRECRFKE
jgi:MIP family channel proteins